MWRRCSAPRSPARAARFTDAIALIRRAAVAAICGALVSGESGAAAGEPPFYANSFEKLPSAAALTDLGRALFFEKSLSASGKLACASCHDPARAFAPPNALAVQRGGADGQQFGLRAVPSLKYTQNIPAFSEHYFDDEGDDGIDQGPAGGRTWDGRAGQAHDQARLPLFSAFEMANANEKAVVAKARRSGISTRIRASFGAGIFENPALAFNAILLALETFQQSPAEFYPYSSKYDAWLRHQATLSDSELRGLTVFNDPAKGNCARCHPSGMRAGAFPQFTDFGYSSIGAPRNMAIPANAERGFYDLGLCGPLRADLAGVARYCGAFRTPSLRNVATRGAFMHNGVFHRLQDVLRFYAERDTQPAQWYPHAADGSVRKFDDLPVQYQVNVDAQAPFGRRPGDPPALSDQDIADLAAFLYTLTDGYLTPQAAPAAAAQN
jgi:cytochrome c peroxidase